MVSVSLSNIKCDFHHCDPEGRYATNSTAANTQLVASLQADDPRYADLVDAESERVLSMRPFDPTAYEANPIEYMRLSISDCLRLGLLVGHHRHTFTCYSKCRKQCLPHHGGPDCDGCRFGIPEDVTDHDHPRFDPVTGEFTLPRKYGWTLRHFPELLVCARSNTEVKVIISGPKAKALAYYTVCTRDGAARHHTLMTNDSYQVDYTTKGDTRVQNVATILRFVRDKLVARDSTTARALMTSVVLQMTSREEVGAPMAALSMLGLNDHVKWSGEGRGTFSTFFWGPLDDSLRREEADVLAANSVTQRRYPSSTMKKTRMKTRRTWERTDQVTMQTRGVTATLAWI